MGLIIGPLVLAWFAGAVCSGFMWYSIFSGDGSARYALTLIAPALVLTFGYLVLGLRRFRSRESVWAFEIPMFFLINRYALAIGGLAFVTYLFDWNIPGFAHTRALCFVLMFALSVGAILGTFCAGTFVQKRGIRVTY